MSNSTGISWTDATWNPVRGCSRVSEGCRNCYAEIIAARFSGSGQPYEHSGDAHRIEAGRGSKRKTGGVIELPYLDGEQHAEFPESP
jgi:protein gp37